jgi:hypothetical protein
VNLPGRGIGPQFSACRDNRGDFFAVFLILRLFLARANNQISLTREKQVYNVPAELYRNSPLGFRSGIAGSKSEKIASVRNVLKRAFASFESMLSNTETNVADVPGRSPLTLESCGRSSEVELQINDRGYATSLDWLRITGWT